MKKIAMPMSKGNLCDRFEKLEYLLICDFEDPLCIRENMIYPPDSGIDNYPEWLISLGVTDIIVRGIDHEMVKKMNYHKIHVFVGVKKKKPKTIMMDYLNKNLDTDERMCYSDISED